MNTKTGDFQLFTENTASWSSYVCLLVYLIILDVFMAQRSLGVIIL